LGSNGLIKVDIGSFEELEKTAAAKPHYIEELADYNPFDLDNLFFRQALIYCFEDHKK
jgi:hypothetical protein